MAGRQNEKDKELQYQQSLETKKTVFLGYLKSSPAILDQFARVLCGIYEAPQLPEDSQGMVARLVGSPADLDEERLLIEIDRLKQTRQRLKKRLEDVTAEIEQLKAKKALEAEV